MRVPELITATVYSLWKRASNLRERSPHTRVACPALVVFMRHLTRSLLRADGLSQALGRLGRGRRDHGDDPVPRSARHRRGVDPRPAGVGEKIVVVRQRRESRLERRQPLGRDAWGRYDWPGQGLLRQVKLHHLAVGIALDEV